MSGDKQCDRCGNFISWGGTYYEVCEVTGSHSSITHDVCEACGTQLEAWIEEAPPRARHRRVSPMDLNYDIGCFDLASDFLSDVAHATQADIHRLAHLIQTTIEDFIGYDAELNARARAHGEGT